MEPLTSRARPSDMMRMVATLAAVVLLAGCGGRSDGPVMALDDAPSDRPAASPTWPPADCAEISTGIFDFATRAVSGARTAEEAALQHEPHGVSVVRAPKPEPHYARLWWVLDSSGSVIAALGMIRTDDGGWLVGSDERCATEG